MKKYRSGLLRAKYGRFCHNFEEYKRFRYSSSPTPTKVSQASLSVSEVSLNEVLFDFVNSFWRKIE